MTDRELLELAAKAAGEITEEWTDNDAYFSGVLSRWNPLANNGDAFRLGVKLSLFNHPRFYHFLALERFGRQDKDDCAAARRAIVRAAAAIQQARENNDADQ